jgi:hypothetical protein
MARISKTLRKLYSLSDSVRKSFVAVRDPFFRLPDLILTVKTRLVAPNF